MLEIARRANESTSEFGIEVVDVRIKAIELPDDVRESVFRRMAADRQKEANLYRFRGREEAERIKADADRQVQILLAEAQRDGQTQAMAMRDLLKYTQTHTARTKSSLLFIAACRLMKMPSVRVRMS